MASMVVRWRPEVCARAGTAADASSAAESAQMASCFTYSFYFADRGAGDDDGQREEEEGGRDLARYSVGVKKWNRVADVRQRSDCPGADQDREQDAGDRATRYQP